MHPHRTAVTLLLAAAACAPTTFGWQAPTDTAIDDYRRSFAAAAGTRFVATVTRDDLVERARRERVLWLGDHHRSARLHALQFDLLGELQRRGVRLGLALEAIGTQDQAAVDAFLAGDGTLNELRATLRRRWRDSWLDDRELDPAFYRGLLTFARTHGLPVRAFEPTPRLPLAQRDARIAATLREVVAAHADRLLVVVVGQAHLLGDGALVARTGHGGIVVGGEPTPALAALPVSAPRGSLLRTDADVHWFVEVLTPADGGR